MAPLSVPDALAQADLVVVGTVTATRSRDRVATVAADEVWKGPVHQTFEVYGGPAQDNTATGVDRTFQTGSRYLIFAIEPAAHGYQSSFGGRYEASACSTTRLWENTLAAYRPPTTTVLTPHPDPVPPGEAPNRAVKRPDPPDPDTGRDRTPVRWAAAFAATALLLAIVPVWRYRRRRVGPESRHDL